MNDAFQRFLVNKNIDSIETLLSVQKYLADEISCGKCKYARTTYQQIHAEKFLEELPILKNSYNNSFITREAHYFHHGLRFSPQKLRDYVLNRDIMDIGAFIGDSMVILTKYTNKKVMSYELSPKNYKRFFLKPLLRIIFPRINIIFKMSG